jgi:hypothetical protein
MTRSRIFNAGAWALLIILAAPVALAQSPPGGADAPKQSRLAKTKEHFKELLAKWRQNRPKLKACRAEARKKGLADDERWFFISECMGKS